MAGLGTGINVVASHDLDALLGELADRLSVPGGAGSRIETCFAPEVVVVPSKETRTYVLRELSRHLGATGHDDGIVANFLFVYPRQLVYATTGDLPSWPDTREVLGLGGQDWDLASLTWVVDSAIRGEHPDQLGSRDRAPLATARRVAELFDHYVSHRPGMIREWIAPGDQPTRRDRLMRESQEWQIKVFDRVVRSLGDPRSLCALAPEETRSRIGRAADLGLLPARISVFGIVGLSRAARGYLEALADYVEVTAYVVHAASRAWPVLRPVEGETQVEYAARLAAAPGRAERHPLHHRWCASSIEQAALLGTAPTVVGSNEESRVTLLAAMQRDVIDDAARTVDRLDDRVLQERLRAGDGSVQVHSCYGTLRQAEALRDSLLRVLRDNPDLHLRDVAIATAAPEKVAAVLAAVLDPGTSGGPHGQLPRLSVSVSGSSSESRAPLVEAFLAVIRLASSRCSPGEMLEVLAMPHVSRRFGLDSEALGTVTDWIDETGIRHGLDRSHRLAVSEVPWHVTATTWVDALRRVALGAAAPSPLGEPGPGGIVPLDSVSSGALPTFGALAEFVFRLARLAVVLGVEGGLTVDAWVAAARSVLVDFLLPTDDDAETLSQIRSALAADLSRAAAAPRSSLEVRYPVADLTAVLAAALPVEFHSYSTPWESILVTTLEGLAHRPREVVAVFSANEEMFAGGSADGDNVLANSVEVGEPNYSKAGRQNFLHAMMTARRAFIVTCDGADVSNNKPTPLAVPVRELLEVAAATLRDRPVEGEHAVLAVHPRQNYDELVLTAGAIVGDEPFTFDPVAPLANAIVRGGGTVPADVRVAAPVVPAPVPGSVPLADIARAVRNPLEYHLQTVLGVELPESAVGGASFGREPAINGDGVIPLSIDGLAESVEGRDLLERLSRDPSGDSAETIAKWRENRPRAGLLPPGLIGESVVLAVATEVTAMLEVLPPELRDISLAGDLEQTIALADQTVAVRVPSVSTVSPAIVRPRFKRFDESILIDAWVELAALTLARGDDANHVAHVVARGRKSGTPPEHRILEIVGSNAGERCANAADALGVAFGIHRAASADQIPLFEKASRAMAGAAVTGKRTSVRKAFDEDVEKSAAVRFVLDRRGWDEVSTEPLANLERSIFGATGNVGRFDFYAELLWGTFARTCRVTDPADAASPASADEGKDHVENEGDDE